MDEDLHNIEDLFHSALDDNEETPSQNVWDGVEKRLDKDNIVSIKKKYTNLKRIAILLFLLLGISIYEMDRIHNSNNLAKNNNPGSEKEKKPAQIIDKASEQKTGNVSGKSFEPKKINNNTDKENGAIANSFNDSQKIIKQQKAGTFSKRSVQKQNKDYISDPEKNISKNLATLNSSTKGKLTSKPFYKIKIKNANLVEDEQLPLQNNDEQVFYQIPFSRKLKNISIENMILHSKDSIDIRNSLQLLMASAIKVFDTNNNVAQTIEKKTKRLSRFSITPFFSPDIAWYHLQDENINNQSGNASDIEREEKHEFSSTYGALVDYKIDNHWGLQSGLTLSNTNITTEPEIIYAQPDNTGKIKYRINSSSGYGFILPSYSANPVIGDSLYAFTSTHSLQYIDIPIAVTYSIAKSKFTFSATAGISANFLTKAKMETTVEKGFDNSIETVNNIQGLKKIYFSGIAGIGVDFQLSKRTALAFAPTVRFALNPINKNATVKSYPMSFGSSVGLKFGL